MARIRTVKPEIWRHEELSALPEATHLLAIQLLTYADDYGYFNANPSLIEAEVSPLRKPSVTIPESLASLSKIGYVALGTGTDKRRYGRIINFEAHQRVSHPSESKIKKISITWDDPPNDSGTPPEPLTTSSDLNREQGTGKGVSTLGHPPAGPPQKSGRTAKATEGGYPPAFERAWSALPKRSGNNPKSDAFKAWGARIKEGASEDALEAGARRYANYCNATRKTSTEYVMRGSTFFGPAKPFEQDFHVDEEAAKPRIDSQCIYLNGTNTRCVATEGLVSAGAIIVDGVKTIVHLCTQHHQPPIKNPNGTGLIENPNVGAARRRFYEHMTGSEKAA